MGGQHEIPSASRPRCGQAYRRRREDHWRHHHSGQRQGKALSRLMRVGPVAALLIAKIIAGLLVALALALTVKRPRLVVFLNYWFAAVVSWNLVVILLTQLSDARRN